MEEVLQDPAKGWRILYTDKENDVMVVGDDPWKYVSLTFRFGLTQYAYNDIMNMRSVQ